MYRLKSADRLTMACVVARAVVRGRTRVVARVIGRATLDVVALGLPGRQAALDPGHVAEARPTEQ